MVAIVCWGSKVSGVMSSVHCTHRAILGLPQKANNLPRRQNARPKLEQAEQPLAQGTGAAHSRVGYPCAHTVADDTPLRILIVGAGGQGRVAADALLQASAASGAPRIVGFLDADPELHGQFWHGIPIIGGMEALGSIGHDAVVVAIGDNATRRRVALSSDMHDRPLR